MTRDPVTIAPELTLGQFMDDVVRQRRHTTYPFVDGDRVVRILPFRRVAEIPRNQWDVRHVRDCMLPPGDVPNLTEDERAVDVLGALAGTELERALVIDDGRLAGVLSVRDLARALQPSPRRRGH